MIRLRLRASAAVLLGASLVFGLAACSPSAETVGADLHASTVQVATRAAAGDYLGAIAELTLLEQDVAAAVEDGSIDAEQAGEINDALALVRADLEAAEVATTPTPTPTTTTDEDDSDPGNSGNKGKGNDKDKPEKADKDKDD